MFGSYVPAHAEIAMYDISGRIVTTQRIYHRQNNVCGDCWMAK